MESGERKQLIMALYEFAWKITELESESLLKRLSKKGRDDKLTEEATKKVTGRIGISPQELHTIIREISLRDNR